MTTKDDMIKRQKDLLDSLNNDTFNRQDFLKKHNILDRTLRRDLNTLAEQGQIFEDKINYLRNKCLGKLTKKVANNELSDGMMLQIVMSGIATKQEIKSNSNLNLNANVTGIGEAIQKIIQFSDEPDES